MGVLVTDSRANQPCRRYIERNDDAGDATSDSRIAGSFPEAEYRIIVKGYKRDVEGLFSVLFSVLGTCAGAGCSGTSMDRRAEGEPMARRPAARPYTPTCGARLVAQLAEGIRIPTGHDRAIIDHGGVTMRERCGLPAAVAHAVEVYRAEQAIPDGTALAYTFESWSSAHYVSGARVRLSAAGVEPASYYYARGPRVGDPQPYAWLFARVRETGTELACDAVR